MPEVRLIDANALYEKVDESQEHNNHQGIAHLVHNTEHEHFKYMIHQAPTVEAEPVKYGQWIHIRTAGVISLWKCSECNNTITANFAITNPANHDKFCYNCGAKMYGGEQEVDN